MWQWLTIELYPLNVIARFARIIAQSVELAGAKIIGIHTSVPRSQQSRKRNKMLLALTLLDIDKLKCHTERYGCERAN
jgi:hypothetical protein